MGKCLVAPVGGSGAVAGSYQGELSKAEAYERNVEVGFCPSAVILVQSASGKPFSKVQVWNENSLAIAIRGLYFTPWDYSETVLVTENGFQVKGAGSSCVWNNRNITYAYVAIP